MARKTSNAIYNTIPKFWEWLIVNNEINAIEGVLRRFYIFRGEKLRDDYIKLCKPSICMAIQKRTWMITFLFKEFLFFLNKSILVGVSFSNPHLLILDGHNNHVTLEAIENVFFLGLDMITLPSHTSYALQLLDVCCFKPFKIVFRKVSDAIMCKRNHMELDKITLARWVDYP